MFNDRQKALEALEAELLMEEEIQETQQDPEPAQPIYRNYSNNYGQVEAYNRDVAAENLEDYVEEVHSGKESSGVKGLVALALALVAGIFVMLAFWAVRYL